MANQIIDGVKHHLRIVHNTVDNKLHNVLVDVAAGTTTDLGTVDGSSAGDMLSAAVNEDAIAAHDIIAAPAAGHQLWIYGYELHANVSGTLQFLDGDSTALTGIMPVPANGGMVAMSPYPIFKCPTAKSLKITAVTCAVDGIIQYRDVTI